MVYLYILYKKKTVRWYTVYLLLIVSNVNPGLINNGLLIMGSPNSAHIILNLYHQLNSLGVYYSRVDFAPPMFNG